MGTVSCWPIFNCVGCRLGLASISSATVTENDLLSVLTMDVKVPPWVMVYVIAAHRPSLCGSIKRKRITNENIGKTKDYLGLVSYSIGITKDTPNIYSSEVGRTHDDKKFKGLRSIGDRHFLKNNRIFQVKHIFSD